jgi:hypothetical protein
MNLCRPSHHPEFEWRRGCDTCGSPVERNRNPHFRGLQATSKRCPPLPARTQRTTRGSSGGIRARQLGEVCALSRSDAIATRAAFAAATPNCIHPRLSDGDRDSTWHSGPRRLPATSAKPRSWHLNTVRIETSNPRGTLSHADSHSLRFERDGRRTGEAKCSEPGGRSTDVGRDKATMSASAGGDCRALGHPGGDLATMGRRHARSYTGVQAPDRNSSSNDDWWSRSWHSSRNAGDFRASGKILPYSSRGPACCAGPGD